MIKNIRIKKTAVSVLMAGTLSLIPYQSSFASTITDDSTFMASENSGDVLGCILGMGLIVFASTFLSVQDLKKQEKAGLDNESLDHFEVKQKKLGSIGGRL